MSEIKVHFDHTRFPKSVEKLSAEQRRSLRRLAEALTQRIPPPWCHCERVLSNREWRSARLDNSSGYRVIYYEENGYRVLCHVAPHDDAYAWAHHNRRPSFNEYGEFVITDLLGEEAEEPALAATEITSEVDTTRYPFAAYSSRDLVRLGAPHSEVSALQTLEREDLCARLAELRQNDCKCLCIIFSIPPRPTASSLQPPPHAAKPHPHNNDAASNHPSHDATPFPSSSNEDYNTVNNAHATHTPTNAPNTYESPANDETTHYPNTPPSAHPDALPPALTHPNTAPQPPSDTNPTPPQTLSDAPRPLASPNDLSHSHDPHAHPRAAHRAPCPPPSNYTPKATITQSRFRPKTTPDTPPQLPPFYLLPLGAERFHRRHLWDAGWHIAGALVDIPHPLQVAGQRGGMHLHLHLGR
jgi:mRNA-degrading endonuclease RelE of RelBE toxin-antitoxin system